MKLLLINTTSNNVITFRKDLINRLNKDGHDIFVVVNDGEREEEIKSLGVTVINIEQDNRSKNIFKAVSYLKSIKRIMKKVNPDKVFSFQVKPNTLGVLVAKKYCHDIYAMVEGMGDVFIKQNIIWKCIRILVKIMYKKSFKYVKKVFFLNKDDRSYFIRKRLISKDKALLINGIGIDIEKIAKKRVLNFNSLIMVARLLKSKGVIEYCRAAEICKNKGYNYEFLLVGKASELKIKDIQYYIENKYIKYIDFTKDVISYLYESTVFVLPSYREGLPMSTMEAMACGRAIITTNVPGCKETVIEDYNGYFANVKDPFDLSEKIILLMNEKERIEEFGKNSRKLVEEKFNQKNINDYIVREIT